MKRLAWVVIGLALAWLSGCATMTVEECKVARWSDVGLRDGLAGKPLSRLDGLVKDCAEAKVTVDTNSYLRGRDQGLVTYCRMDNAVNLGLAGRTYEGACPASIDGQFRRRFSVAREVYDARSDLNSRDSRRNDLERRLRDAKNDDERRRARDDLRSLDYDQRRARDRLRDAEYALDRLR